MHIPDGFLDVKTWAALDAAAAVAIVYSSKRVSKELDERAVPLMGVTAAFVFAAQMLNFPIAGGTSGHFMGGVLAAALLGPWAGCIVMTAVLIIQALVFQDGGVLALGANVVNMAVIGSVGGYLVYNSITKVIGGKFGLFSAAFLAGWVSVVGAATACAGELALSNTIPLNVALPAMAGIHALIGVGEGIITGLALITVYKARPDLIVNRQSHFYR
jgi:cobalt/nickel transport system permease protein